MAPIKEGRLTESQEELLLMISFYEHVLDKKEQTLVVDECLKVFHHSKEHYAKIRTLPTPVQSGISKVLSSPAPVCTAIWILYPTI